MTRNAGLAIGRTPWRTPRCRRLVVGAGVRDLLDRAKILFFGANLRARARDLADAGRGGRLLVRVAASLALLPGVFRQVTLRVS